MSQTTPGIVLNAETGDLINRLIILDTNSSKQKYVLFNRLLELWKTELATGETPANKFSESKAYIKSVILVFFFLKYV